MVGARLHSGRTHQIRASLCSSAYPIVGDRLYGLDSMMYLRFIDDQESIADRKALRMERSALHAHKLEFVHPNRLEKLSFCCDLPEDMQALRM